MLVELGCERVIGFKTLDLRATSASMACMRHERASAKATAGLHLRLPHIGYADTHGHGKTRVCSCERDKCVWTSSNSGDTHTEYHLPGWKYGADGGCRIWCAGSYATAVVTRAGSNNQTVV